MIRSAATPLFHLSLVALLLVAFQTPEAEGKALASDTASGSAVLDTTEAEHRERTEQAWSDYEAALLEGNAARAVAIFSKDLTVRGPSSVVHGRAARREQIEQFLSSATLEYLKGEVEDVVDAGDHVFVAGTWSEQFRRDNDDEPVKLEGNYAWLWRLDDDGEWRVSYFIWNQRPDPGS